MLKSHASKPNPVSPLPSPRRGQDAQAPTQAIPANVSPQFNTQPGLRLSSSDMEYNFAQETVDIPAHLSSLLTLISVSASQPVSAPEFLRATSLWRNQDAKVSTTQTNHAQTP